MKHYILFVLLMLGSALSEAQVTLESAKRLEVNATYDSLADPGMQQVMDAYKMRLDAVVSRSIGYSAQLMTARAPESLLSNFLSDQLKAKACEYVSEPVDVAIINLGGIRSSIKAGTIAVKDVYKVMPFENKLVILVLKGSDLLSIFQHIAREGGEGISGAALEIRKQQIYSLLIGGKPLDEAHYYQVATMDYLADGNSGMTAFRNAAKRIDTGKKIRDCYIEQIEKLTANGEKVDARLDGRIKLVQE
ncbi:MAG: 5'-nucleotidase C-terminal domain-containing protein [Bacteroidota bacterium]|nr:5'-nucleotidase C-terminal domain-containing protein [Bacteroidota bacterium]